MTLFRRKYTARKARAAASPKTEHAIQARFFAYLSRINHPAVALTFAVPMGFLRSKSMRLRAWKEGARKGIPDVLCLYPTPQAPGLILEFKSASGTLTPEQRAYLAEFKRLGYRTAVVRTAEEALQVWCDYLGLELRVER